MELLLDNQFLFNLQTYKDKFKVYFILDVCFGNINKTFINNTSLCALYIRTYPLQLRLPQQNRCGCGCGCSRTPNRNEFSIFLKFILKTYKPWK